MGKVAFFYRWAIFIWKICLIQVNTSFIYLGKFLLTKKNSLFWFKNIPFLTKKYFFIEVLFLQGKNFLFWFKNILLTKQNPFFDFKNFRYLFANFTILERKIFLVWIWETSLSYRKHFLFYYRVVWVRYAEVTYGGIITDDNHNMQIGSMLTRGPIINSYTHISWCTVHCTNCIVL